MNKEALRTQFVGDGWEVEPVNSWNQVSNIEGKVKYDVKVVSPDNHFGTAQVIVTDDGGGSEDAVTYGTWATEDNFDARVRAYGRSLEGGQLFAISVNSVNPQDDVAVATVYFSDGSVKSYVCKERDGVFSHQELI